MKNQSSKNTRNMETKPVPKHIQSTISALTDFVIGIYLDVSPNDSGAKFRQSMLDHQDKFVKILNDNLTVQKPQTLKKFKDPDAPKRGKSSYIYFCVEKREEIKNANPDMSATEIIKELGRVWREDTSENDKARYAKMSSEDKLRYEDAMKDYTPNIVPSNEKKQSGPKRGLSSYIFFCKEHREKLKKDKPDLTTKEITAELGKLWRELTDNEREPYNKLAETDKVRYEQEKISLVENKIPNPVTKKSNSSKKDSLVNKNIHSKSGYILYCQEKRPALKEANNKMTNQQITKELARTWKELSDEEKEKYNYCITHNTKKSKSKSKSDSEEFVEESN